VWFISLRSVPRMDRSDDTVKDRCGVVVAW